MSCLVYFRSLVWFHDLQLNCFRSLTRLSLTHVSSHSGQLFNQAYTTCPAPNVKQKVSETDMSLKSLQRPKELKGELRLVKIMIMNADLSTGVVQIGNCLKHLPPACSLCQRNGTLEHMGEGRYRWRHDQVHKTIAESIGSAITSCQR